MSSSSSLNSKQLAWAKKIVDVIKGMDGLSSDQKQRACDIALATVRVESNFRMYANSNNPASLKLPHDAVGSDHGSVGLYQQQVGGAPNSTANWGTTEQCMNVIYSTHKFVNQLLKTNWLYMTNGAAAQAVQGSAFPDRYAAQDAWAIELRKELWNSGTTSATKPHTPPVQHATKEYVVKSGDTLTSIAKQHNTTVDRLVKLNHIDNPNFIRIGQLLKLG